MTKVGQRASAPKTGQFLELEGPKTKSERQRRLVVPHPTLNFRRPLKRTNQDPFGN